VIFDFSDVRKLSEIARRRAGMSLEELSMACGVPVDELTAYESGTSSPSLERLADVVAGAGASLIVGLGDDPATDRMKPPGPGLHALVSELLIKTAPPRAYPSELAQTWLYAPVGLLILAREQLHAALLLDVMGHWNSVGPAMARAIFEHVATALWIAEDPESGQMHFIQDSNYRLEKLAEQVPEWESRRLHARRRWADAYGDERFARPLPPFQQRLIGPMGEWYPRYRELSLRTHPTQPAIEALLFPGTDGVEVRSGGRNEGLLAFAAMMVWFLAAQLEIDFHPFDGTRTKLGFEGDMEEFAMLGPSLNAFTVEQESEIQ
jgi:transcriptional regulator with XRE-family HTH domain